MEINILDLIFYVVFGIINWVCLPSEFKFEFGMLVGWAIMILYTLLYLIIFAVFDINVIDLLPSFTLSEIKFTL